MNEYLQIKTFNYTGTYKEINLHPGDYAIECYGSQGAGNNDTNGLGGYTKGTINIIDKTKIYLYVGGNTTGFNGGGLNPRANIGYGGGASDIRLVKNEWNHFDSLKSRIMVAAGGGSRGSSSNYGAHGGGLIGNSTSGNYSTWGGHGGTQIGPGAINETYLNCVAEFGKGGSGNNGEIGAINSGYGGSGGGGYYGGNGVYPNATTDNDLGGGGGSSFISGHLGCNAITKESTYLTIVHTGQPDHYSGLVFTDTEIIPGMNIGEGKIIISTTNGNIDDSISYDNYTFNEQILDRATNNIKNYKKALLNRQLPATDMLSFRELNNLLENDINMEAENRKVIFDGELEFLPVGGTHSYNKLSDGNILLSNDQPGAGLWLYDPIKDEVNKVADGCWNIFQEIANGDYIITSTFVDSDTEGILKYDIETKEVIKIYDKGNYWNYFYEVPNGFLIYTTNSAYSLGILVLNDNTGEVFETECIAGNNFDIKQTLPNDNIIISFSRANYALDGEGFYCYNINTMELSKIFNYGINWFDELSWCYLLNDNTYLCSSSSNYNIENTGILLYNFEENTCNQIWPNGCAFRAKQLHNGDYLLSTANSTTTDDGNTRGILYYDVTLKTITQILGSNDVIPINTNPGYGYDWLSNDNIPFRLNDSKYLVSSSNNASNGVWVIDSIDKTIKRILGSSTQWGHSSSATKTNYIINSMENEYDDYIEEVEAMSISYQHHSFIKKLKNNSYLIMSNYNNNSYPGIYRINSDYNSTTMVPATNNISTFGLGWGYGYLELSNGNCLLSSTKIAYSSEIRSTQGIALYNIENNTIQKLFTKGYQWGLNNDHNSDGVVLSNDDCLLTNAYYNTTDASESGYGILKYNNETETITEIMIDDSNTANWKIIKDSNSDKCFLYSSKSVGALFYVNGNLYKVDNKSLPIHHTLKSGDILFSGNDNNNSGLYRFNLNECTIEKIFDTGYSYTNIIDLIDDGYLLNSNDKSSEGILYYNDSTKEINKIYNNGYSWGAVWQYDDFQSYIKHNSYWRLPNNVSNLLIASNTIDSPGLLFYNNETHEIIQLYNKGYCWGFKSQLSKNGDFIIGGAIEYTDDNYMQITPGLLLFNYKTYDFKVIEEELYWNLINRYELSNTSFICYNNCIGISSNDNQNAYIFDIETKLLIQIASNLAPGSTNFQFNYNNYNVYNFFDDHYLIICYSGDVIVYKISENKIISKLTDAGTDRNGTDSNKIKANFKWLTHGDCLIGHTGITGDPGLILWDRKKQELIKLDNGYYTCLCETTLGDCLLAANSGNFGLSIYRSLTKTIEKLINTGSYKGIYRLSNETYAIVGADINTNGVLYSDKYQKIIMRVREWLNMLDCIILDDYAYSSYSIQNLITKECQMFKGKARNLNYDQIMIPYHENGYIISDINTIIRRKV